MERRILTLGHPALYEISEEVTPEDLPGIEEIRTDLRDTLLAFRRKYGVGRAIAAPQIGVKKRIIYRHLDTPILLINPVMEFPDDEMMELLDDCMSFPGLMVRVLRHKRCVIYYKDEHWQDHVLRLEGDMSELMQHEYDHLDGILSTMRAVDSRAFYLKTPADPGREKRPGHVPCVG